MFDAEDIAVLIRRIDRFAVPMFVADRVSDGPWILQCVNDAHTRVTGMTNQTCGSITPHDVLPHAEAELVCRRYSSCINRGDVIHYAEKLHIKDRCTAWKTTLQPIAMSDGRHRVLGTSLYFAPEDMADHSQDAAYFASVAQMQVGKVQTFLDALENRPDLPLDARQKAMMVAGLVRSLDHVLWDMRQSIKAHPGALLTHRTAEALSA